MGTSDKKAIEDIQKLINVSGINHHTKVVRWLAKNGWDVRVSPYYMDQTQNKAREIDLIAEKHWNIINEHTHKIEGRVIVRLFVECKYVQNYSVFWFADKDKESAVDCVKASARSLTGSRNPFKQIQGVTKKHHYLAEPQKAAKLFATQKINSQEHDPFYKALDQTLKALISMTNRPYSPPDSSPQKADKILIEFPVIVCNSFENIYSVDSNNESDPMLIKDNFMLEVSYAYIDENKSNQNKYFLIDVIDFNQLDKFSKTIFDDAKLSIGPDRKLEELDS